MPLVESDDVRKDFEGGVVILSLDTEQIWGYLDQMNEAQFRIRYPDALAAQEKVLACLSAAGVSATWFLVGGMALRGSDGARDPRMAGLPAEWTEKIPAGVEATTPLWYRHSFVQRLRKARPFQEIGLHGGLTHLIWTDEAATRDVVKRELSEGVKALEQAQVRPLSFSYGREQEAYHELLPAHGIRCYRGRTAARAFQLGPTLRGKLARLLDELRRETPPPVWPQETLPGLWNIPVIAVPLPHRSVENQGRRIAIPHRAVQPRTGRRRAPSWYLSLLPSSRESHRITVRLFLVRRHPGSADSNPRPRRYRNSDHERGRRPDGTRARAGTAGHRCRYAVWFPHRSQCRRTFESQLERTYL